jgi:hypothetical protein
MECSYRECSPDGVAKEKGTAIVQTIDPAFALDRDKYFLDIALSPLPKLSRDQWYAEPAIDRLFFGQQMVAVNCYTLG